MKKKCRVLVTGVGGGVGQAILKALRLSNVCKTIIAGDISPMAAGLFLADESILLPRVESKNGLEKIKKILNQKEIDLVLPGNEYELMFFSLNKDEIENSTKAKVVIAPPDTVLIANDKWSTAEFLRKNGLPYAESYVPKYYIDALTVSKKWGFPIILKARSGTSSRNVHFIQKEEDLKMQFCKTPNPMLQKVIQQPTNGLGHEYTCSIFKSLSGKIQGPFIARRTVRGGTSWLIEVNKFPKIRETLLKIGENLKYHGPLNVQLMMTNQGAVPFEINARFSGTTGIRAFFGFNEPEMCVHEIYFGKKITKPAVGSGLALRYHDEVYIPGVQEKSLRLGKHKRQKVIWT